MSRRENLLALAERAIESGILALRHHYRLEVGTLARDSALEDARKYFTTAAAIKTIMAEENTDGNQ